MKVCELVSKTTDRIIVYKDDADDFIDIFVGKKEDISTEILDMEVKVFGCKRKGVLDIQVKYL